MIIVAPEISLNKPQLFYSTEDNSTGMEVNSTINKKWMFCIFTSFIGCMILFFLLRQGPYRVNLSPPRNIAVPLPFSNDSNQHPAANVQFLQTSNTTADYHGNEIDEEEDSCNIFDGKWVYDPTASPLYSVSQCPFLSDQVSCQRNGRPDFEYEKWSWEAKGCEIPR